MKKWKIELTEDQLYTIAEALEFTSRFHCGQIGSSYLPGETRQLLWNKEDWDNSRKRTDQFDALAGILGNVLHEDLSCSTGHSKGVGFSEYSDNLYDYYKLIRHKLHIESAKDLPEDEYHYNVYSYYNKQGNEPDLEVSVIEE